MKFWLSVTAAVLSILAGLMALIVAIANWASPLHCFRRGSIYTSPRTYSHVYLVCRKTSSLATGTSPWVFLAIAIGLFILGVVLARFANRFDRHAVAA